MCDTTTDPITEAELRRDVETVLARYGLTIDEFLAADVDELETDELRDLWLLTEGALHPA